MPRIPYPDVSRLPETVRQTLASSAAQCRPHECPCLSAPVRGARPTWPGRRQSAVLDPRLRETVILRVAHLSNSAYELHHHIALGRAAGLSEVELGALAVENYAALSPLLAAAARFTDEVVKQMSPSNETLANLRKLASDQVVVNIVLTIGCYMSIARLIAVTGIEPDANALGHLPSSLGDGAD